MQLHGRGMPLELNDGHKLLQLCVESCWRLGQCRAPSMCAYPVLLPCGHPRKRRLIWVSPALAPAHQSTTERAMLDPNLPIAFLEEGP